MLRTHTKSQAQRIKDAARILSAYDHSGVKQTYEEWAAKILEAADRAPWPTDESLGAVWNAETSLVADRETARDRLRGAFLADPVVKAAVAYAHSAFGRSSTAGPTKDLVDAVSEAGL